MITTPFEMAQQFIGISEANGLIDNPLILSFLRVDESWPEHDEVPWCSGFINFVCKCCIIHRSKSLAARSWLNVGTSVPIDNAVVGFDIVVLERGAGGHVGFFAGFNVDGNVRLLGGNQDNKVSISSFPKERILGIRRVD